MYFCSPESRRYETIPRALLKVAARVRAYVVFGRAARFAGTTSKYD